MPTIDRHYFKVCTSGARRAGHDIDRFLRTASIDPASIDQPGWRGSTRSMARLVRHVVRTLDDEHMGFTAHALPPGSFAFAAGLAIEGLTVFNGLTRAMRFYNLASRDIVTRLVETDGEVRIVFASASPGLDPDRYYSEFWLIGWHRLACWLAAETIPLVGAAFDYVPDDGYLDEFRRLFPCPQRFDADERSIRLEARALKAPIRRTAADLRIMVGRAPLDIMTIPAGDRDTTRRARQVFARDPALLADGVAAALSLSPDALRRRLTREGTTLSAVREAWRREAAIRALLRGDRSVETIAAELGYAEARSFTRAFRGWTGHSPTSYRRHCLPTPGRR